MKKFIFIFIFFFLLIFDLTSQLSIPSDNYDAMYNTTLITENEQPPCNGFYIEYSNFQNVENINLVNNSSINNDILRLTTTSPKQAGGAWLNIPVPVGYGFETEFQFRISEGEHGNSEPEGSLPGGDGFAFVIQNYGLETIGLSDWGIGYEGIVNSLAIEYDLFKNLYNSEQNIFDPNGNHIAVQSMGAATNTSVHKFPATLAITDTIFNIEPFGTSYWSKINYDIEDSTLKIYLSETQVYGEPVLVVHNLVLHQLLNLNGDSAAYLGFTASTGDSWENHDILSWSICGEFIPGCDITEFHFPAQDLSNKFILGDSATANRIDYLEYFRLTTAKKFQKGSVWHYKKVPVSKGFSTNFSFRIYDGDNDEYYDGSHPGADGIAFVIQNDSIPQSGNDRAGIGYDGIPNSLAVEFDTYNNNLPGDKIGDPNGNHVAVQCNGVLPNTANHASDANLGLNSDIIEIIPDGRMYHIKIDYDADNQIMKIYFDDEGLFAQPVLIVDSLDLTKLLNLDNNSHAYVGITASTGNAFEVHEIMNWEMCPKPVPLGPNDVGDNHNSFSNTFPNCSDLIYIYPQPASERLYIRYGKDIPLNPPFSKGEINVYNVLGEVVVETSRRLVSTGLREIELDVSGLTSGIYFISLKHGSQTITKQFVVVN